MSQMQQVWEFANDGLWTRYDDDTQEQIRQAKEAKLPQVKVSPYHVLDFDKYRQFHQDDSSRWRGVRMVRVVQDKTTPRAEAQTCRGHAEKLQWEFKLDGPGWQCYPEEVNERINEARRTGQNQVEVPTNHIINFAQGRQFNKSDISRWRAVRSRTTGH